MKTRDRWNLRLDLFPSIAREELDGKLQTACRQGRLGVVSMLSADLPHRLAECSDGSCPGSAWPAGPGPVAS